MRDSYTVTLPEEPPALPDLHKDLRPRTSMPGSLLVSTFVGLVLNKTKVRDARSGHSPGLGERRGAAPAFPGEPGVPCAIPRARGWGARGWVPSRLPAGTACPGAPQDGREQVNRTWQDTWVPLPALPLP